MDFGFEGEGRIDMPSKTPVLDRFRLTVDDLAALRRQGFVSSELRRCKVYYKLRFRRDGKRVVRYVGNDPATADQLLRELEVLQADRHDKLQDARLCREARIALRETKARLEPLLEAAGHAFRGYEIRTRKK